jgi:feruloyl esterase
MIKHACGEEPDFPPRRWKILTSYLYVSWQIQRGAAMKVTGRTWSGLVYVTVAAISSAFACVPAMAADCSVDALNGLNIANLTVTSAKLVPAAEPKQEYCDVRGSVATDGEGAGPNSAAFDLMLPAKWNGKFMFTGGRGQGGSLNSAANSVDVDQFLVIGYAAVTSDDGHPNSDRKWSTTSPGQGNMPKLVDYFYRAVHQVTLATKEMTKAYYKAPAITHAYYEGCSEGGREAVMEATRYPADFDGIVAGSAWVDPVGTELEQLKNVKALIKAPIPLDKFDAIDAAIFGQCDALDGVKDGLIQNPAACSFKPESLVPSVLTKEQAEALKIYFSALKDKKGNLIFPGSSVSDLKMQFGLPTARMVEADEAPSDPTGPQPWGKGEVPHLWSSATGVIITLGYRDPSVDLNNAVEEDGGVVKDEALQTLYGRLRAEMADDPASFKTYFSRGGKLIFYHGLSDPVISPYGVVWLYEDLADQAGGYANLEKNSRLFLVPAMQHCYDGPTPTHFDTLTALENWVEKGEGPDSIASTHFNGKTPDRSMPLCKFPEMPHYKGSGDVNDGQNWSCDANDKSMLKVGLNGEQAGMTQRSKHTALVKGTPSSDLGK